jgi:hypothetical protein
MSYDSTVVHVQEFIISITYFRRYLTYLRNSMCVMIHSRCCIHRTSLGFVYINTDPVMSYDFTVVHIQVKVMNITYLRRYLTYLGNSVCVTVPSWCHIHRTSPRLFYINRGPCHVMWFYGCSYTGVSNHHNVSPSLNDTSRQFDVRYNPLLVPHTPHVIRICLNKHWTLSCHMILLLFIYRYK